MSSVWRQSARHPNAAEAEATDPTESLLWRAPVRRLSAEEIRDAMLSVSGELQTRVGGPSVKSNVPRRSIYVKSFRNNPDEFLHTFDAANGLKSVAHRGVTTTPTQSLLLINSAHTLHRAERLAARFAQETRRH